jgi:hypothetical protein
MAMKKEIIQTRNRKMNKKLIIKVRKTFFSLIRRVINSAYPIGARVCVFSYRLCGELQGRL